MTRQHHPLWSRPESPRRPRSPSSMLSSNWSSRSSSLSGFVESYEQVRGHIVRLQTWIPRWIRPVSPRRPRSPSSMLSSNGSSRSSSFSSAYVAHQRTTAPKIGLDELRKATKKIIGYGSYGEVYYGVLNNGSVTAIKRLRNLEQPENEFLAQVSMVSKLEHENVVNLVGYSAEGDFRALAYEYAAKGSLRDVLHGRKGPDFILSWAQRVNIAVGAARGLEYLHEKTFIHRNVGSSNVLIFDNDVAKIGEFDLSNDSNVPLEVVEWSYVIMLQSTLRLSSKHLRVMFTVSVLFFSSF